MQGRQEEAGDLGADGQTVLTEMSLCDEKT